LSYASRLPEKPCGGIAFTRFEQTGITSLFKKNIAQEGCGFKTRRRRGAIAKPGMAYPETITLKSTRPTARDPRRQVFVAGVERAATFEEANLATVSLVLLWRLEVEGQAGAEAALLLGEDHQRAVAQ